MTAKLPTQIKIGSQLWELSEQKRKHSVETNHWGFTSIEDQTIVLDSEAPACKKPTVLLHEILHAIKSTFGGSFEPSKTTSFEDWEHYFIGLYEEPLILVLRDNPELATYLLGKD